ncbi:AMP-binding protein [Candidatus Binatia bacterium]|nr:AMP-binding protein [Candidatus Binatia bacterium]
MLLLGDIARRHALYRGDRLAYVVDHADGRTERVTYRALNEGTNRLAHVLRRHGVRRGDRVAILAHNCVEYPWTYFACCKLGAIVVPVNTRYKRDEIRYAIDFAEARVALVGPEFVDEVQSLRRDGALPHLSDVFVVDRGTEATIGAATSAGVAALAPLLAAADASEPEPDDPPDERDAHVMLFTSGTTGAAKGALLSQRAYFLQAGLTQSMNGLTDDDVGLSMFPMFHMGGWATPLGYWSIGGTVVIMRRADPRAMLAAVQRERVAYLYAVPTVYNAMLALPEFATFDLSSLRLLGGGTAYMPREQIERITRAFGVEAMVVMYGQTEAGPVSCLRARDLWRKPGSVGQPVNDVDVRIVDARGEDVAVDTPGEIVVRSDFNMLGYWRMPEATADAFAGGWLHTGDLALWDGEGFLHIVGRSKEMIKTGGENVFPAEIEQTLLTHPDVTECAVVGVPDADWGESVLAVVVPRAGARLTEDDVVAHVRERLAGYKKPRHVRFVIELPRTASTRQVQKALLADRFVQGW